MVQHPALRRKAMVRVGAMIPEPHLKALTVSAEENGRTIAAEIRLALQAWLRQQGRITS